MPMCAMIMLHGGQQDLCKWKHLFAMTKPQLKLVEVKRPDGSKGSINRIMVLKVDAACSEA